MTTLTPLRRPTTARTERVTDEPGVRFGIAEAAPVAALLVAAALRLDAGLTLGLVAVTTVAAAGTLLGPGWSAGLGLSAWAMFTGFAEHSMGTLTFAGGDLLRLAGLVVGCAASAWCARRVLRPRWQA
jgi:hypothetical protein